MCFSMQASFVAAAILSSISIAVACKIRESRQWFIGLIPCFFALQQFCEGFVWMTLNKGDTTSLLHKSAVYLFLFFAYIVWPLYIPSALYILEKNEQRKKWLLSCMALGICISVALAYACVLHGVVAHSSYGHITYTWISLADTSIFYYYAGIIAYAWAVVGAMTLSTIPRMRYMGMLVGVSCVVAFVAYRASFASVWCFFAALISLMTYMIISSQNDSILPENR